MTTSLPSRSIACTCAKYKGMNSLWDLLHAMKQPEEPIEIRHTGEKNLDRRLYLNEIMVEAFQARGQKHLKAKQGGEQTSALPFDFVLVVKQCLVRGLGSRTSRGPSLL